MFWMILLILMILWIRVSAAEKWSDEQSLVCFSDSRKSSPAYLVDVMIKRWIAIVGDAQFMESKGR